MTQQDRTWLEYRLVDKRKEVLELQFRLEHITLVEYEQKLNQLLTYKIGEHDG